MATPPPAVDARDPGRLVADMVDGVLDIAATWPAWDGVPRRWGDREYTPHKAIRRVADHLVDHLAEIDARLAGSTPLPDRWHASSMTTPSDLAPFTELDLEEARSRLQRLSQVWTLRLSGISAAQLDNREQDAWTLREVAFHVSESIDYARAVGRLGDA